MPRRVVAAYDKALAEGVGAVTVDGKMIDVPVVERAKLLLQREEAIAAREARKQARRLIQPVPTPTGERGFPHVGLRASSRAG